MEQAKPLLPGMFFSQSAYECVEGADAVALLTEWDELRALDLERLKSLLKKPVLVDLRNIYDPENAKRVGLDYTSVGRTAIDSGQRLGVGSETAKLAS